MDRGWQLAEPAIAQAVEGLEAVAMRAKGFVSHDCCFERDFLLKGSQLVPGCEQDAGPSTALLTKSVSNYAQDDTFGVMQKKQARDKNNSRSLRDDNQKNRQRQMKSIIQTYRICR